MLEALKIHLIPTNKIKCVDTPLCLYSDNFWSRVDGWNKKISKLVSDNSATSLESCFYNIKTHSLKIDTYFENYESAFEKLKKPDLVVVEVGVLDGGSLEMWQSFFGPTARIIGVEKNPGAVKLRSLGFEILIADQESRSELEKVFKEIGPIDIFIDDGAHTAKGQIVSSLVAAKYVKDGGVIIVEDTHSSFASDFGMPHKYSFANWVHQVGDLLDQAYLVNKGQQNQKSYKQYPADLREFASRVHEIRKFRSLTIFEVRHNSVSPKAVDNMKSGSKSADARWIGESQLMGKLLRIQNFSEWRYTSFGNTNPNYKFLNLLTKSPASLVIRVVLKPISFTCKTFRKSIRRVMNKNLSKFFIK
jgi:hypothetical protein